MSSLCKDTRPNMWRILFVAPDGSRKTLRLGKMAKRSAEAIQRHVDALLAAKIAGQPMPRETAVWLDGIGDRLRARLAGVGLVGSKPRLTVDQYLAEWLVSKRLEGLKSSTLATLKHDIADAEQWFAGRLLSTVTGEDVEQFVAALRKRLSPATLAKRVQRVRQAFQDACERNLLERNPFGRIRVSSGNPAERRVYVPVQQVERVIAVCPNVHWKLLFVLSRYAGLRIPSEALLLKWGDVDWERGRMTVPSPKTERQGKPYRVIPLFPSVKPYLDQAWEITPEGEEFIFPEAWRRRAQGPAGWVNANFRTVALKILRKAEIEPWPRLWQNLRSSCESDLAATFPIATVTKWLGNSPSVALRHYVDPTDEAFERAKNWVPGTPEKRAKSGALGAQNSAQQERALICTSRKD